VPYLLLGLQDVQWAMGNSRGARKLARTPHVNQKKKKKSKQESITSNNNFVFFHWTEVTTTLLFQLCLLANVTKEKKKTFL